MFMVFQLHVTCTIRLFFENGNAKPVQYFIVFLVGGGLNEVLVNQQQKDIRILYNFHASIF